MTELPNADEPHKVPSGYYKIVYDLDGLAQAFLMSQDANRDTDYCTQAMPFSTIRDVLDYDLPGLSDSVVMVGRLGC